jgi:hypothetical protein
MHQMMPWPARSAICLDCRTVLPTGAPCPHGTHRSVSLADPDGREALRRRVWGSRSPCAPEPEASCVGGLAVGGASVRDGFSWTDPIELLDLPGLIVAIALVVVFFSFRMLRFVGRRLVELTRPRQRCARGAQHELPAASATGCIGTIVTSRPLLAAPIDGRPCVAFGLAITHQDGSLRRGPQTMLRDGATLGFEVELASGERARIPAGPCTLDLATARRAWPSPRVDAYLRTVDPQHGGDDDQPPFPCDQVDVATLAPGDRVEILSPVSSIAAAPAAFIAYREAAGIVVPMGPVRLRPLPP